MQTDTLIKASAQITAIVELKPFDVYKRIESEYSGAKLQFGIVTDVMHNGTEGAITALEFPDSTYNTVPQPKLVVFATGKEAALFNATPDEVEAHLTLVREAAQRALDEARRKHDEARNLMGRLEAIIQDVATGRPLTNAVTVRGEIAD